jgi:hypothetical protein
MIEFQDEDGLVFWPEHDVASLTPEFRNRWRAVMRDGSVAHRPTPPPDGPWVPLGNSLVMPCWLTRTPSGWKDPAGFELGGGELPEVPLPQPASAILPKIGCRSDQVLALTAGPPFGCTWHTDLGTVVWPGLSAVKAARHHPNLVCVRRGHHVNRQRLRKITTSDPLITVTLDNGTVVTTTGPGFAKEMGLPSLNHLEPICWEMYAWHQLRDWPFPLLQASGELLRACFPTARRLVANLIWQQLRYRQLGIPHETAESHSDFFYLIKPALYRAGFLQRTTGSVPEDPTDAEGLRLMCFHIMEKLYEARLLTYAELGFVDKPGDTRSLGTRLPWVILVVEKLSCVRYARKLADEFGTSLLILGGTPALIATEFFAAALRQVWSGPFLVIAYVDYDPEGWAIGHATANQIAFHGLQSLGVKFLIRGDCFTANEKQLYARPCSHGTAAQKTQTANWVKESGGLDGRALGIHANHVQPYERVRALFAELVQSL